MVEHLLGHYLFITHSVEVIAALTGVVFFKKNQRSNTKYFIYFLIGLTTCEFLCSYTFYPQFTPYISGTIFEKNHWISTIFWSIGAIMFFSFYYRRILKTTSFKTIIKYLSFAFLFFSIVHILTHWDAFFNTFFPSISVFGAIVIFACTIFYFIETLQSDKILTFYKSINFYITSAIFIWWLVTTPLSFYDVYFRYEIGEGFFDENFRIMRNVIFLFANIIMYLTFTFALIWCKPEND